MIKILKFFICGAFCSLLFPPFLILPFGFIVFPILFYLIRYDNKTQVKKISQFIYGISFGLGLCLILLNWIKEPFFVNPTTQNLSLLSYLVPLYISIYFGIIFLLLSFFKKDSSKIILIPVLFLLAEIVRENFLYGFPWATFALAISGNNLLLQLIYFIGTNGSSLLILYIFLIPVVLAMIHTKENLLFAKIYMTVFVLFFLLFSLLIYHKFNFIDKNNNLFDINFSINQLNIKNTEKITDDDKINIIKNILKIINKQNNTIHIFSETDFPYTIENNNIVNFFQDKLTNNNSIIIGGIRKENNQYFNSMYFISKNNYQYFDKKILVPFGEFLPLRNKLKFFETFIGKVDLQRGNNSRDISIFKGLYFIPVICYEIIFFNNIINNSNSTYPLLINITNDTWFGDFSGPYQHFYLSRLRSVEFNKHLIRVSNNGVSATIDNNGKIIQYIPLNLQRSDFFKINIPKKKRQKII